MLENFIIALEAVAPMFIIMAIGMLVRRVGLLNEGETKRVNRLIFNVFFPPLMFWNIYGSELNTAFDLKLVAYSVIMVLIVFFTAMALVVKFVPENRTRGAMIQAIYRSNFVIMGIPVVTNIFGAENTATAALSVTIIVPLFNIMAVTVLEIFRGGRPNPLHILKGIAKNPLIIGAMFGILAALFSVELPSLVETTVSDMKSVATPMALLVLGASFDINSIKQAKLKLTVCVLARLIIVPAIALTIGALIGIRNEAFVTLIAIFASPTATSSFTMAVQMDSDGELAGNCVIFSSALACFTMFLWIFFFKNLGMF